MSKYIMHNGAFYEVSDDELMHWKYIKREKKNGRWVYYYNQSELDAAKAEADRTTKAFDTMKKADDKLESAKSGKFGKISDAISNSKAYRNTYEKTKNRAREATKQYYKMAVISFPARVVSKGLVKLGNLLSSKLTKKR